MRPRSLLLTSIALFALLMGAVGPHPAGALGQVGGPNAPASAPLGSAFTYQGQLKSGGSPFSGSCSMAFRLYDDPAAGAQVGGAITTPVTVTSGLFTASLDFGGGAFTGAARWLDIQVKCGADPAFTPLTPRQPLSPAPYALALPGLYSQQNANSPNLIGGYSGNVVSGATAYGVTIGGGGEAGLINTVQGSNVTFDTISGGVQNTISGTNVFHGSIGGGIGNTITGASANEDTIGGGYFNRVTASNATIAGGQGNAAGGNWASVGGGLNNKALSDASSIAGGNNNVVSAPSSFIGGGSNNLITGANTYDSVIGGGNGNAVIGSSGLGLGSVVGGGGSNIIYGSTSSNMSYATIGGGQGNQITGTSNYQGVIAGGGANVISGTSGADAVIGGGYSNRANGSFATIAGGSQNTATGFAVSVGGGYSNTAGTASGDFATVSGGLSNTASGKYATVTGGQLNTATATGSFSAGQNAHATDAGSFVWGDGSQAANSTGANTFSVLSVAGATFYVGIGSCGTTDGVGWSCSSDRNLKENFTPLDPRATLEALSRLPVTEWNMKGSSVKHIGPTAQDFYAAFNVGADDRHINTVDAQGVALAAIQGLYHLAQSQDAQLKSQQTQIDDLQTRLSTLEHQPTTSPPQLPFTNYQLPLLGWLLFGALLLLNLGGLLGYLVARGRRAVGGGA